MTDEGDVGDIGGVELWEGRYITGELLPLCCSSLEICRAAMYFSRSNGDEK